MPLVRLEVRNEYGLGQPELYKKADREDPKAVLDGVAVAGLVGILRQLGDLAEFAAEVFHGLQEQVMTTASRSHKLKGRVKHLEAALTPLEKAVLAQTSHIHFAYTAGSEWHPRIRNERNHFIYNDLPRFIMDSYEECRDPPRLHLLDKFDTGGPGSCLKKYSDPTFFKKLSVSSDEVTTGKVQIDKKARRSKKKRSSQGNGQLLRATSVSNHSSRFELASSTINGQTSPLQTGSAADMKYNSDLGDHSNSFDSSGLPFASHVDNRQASPSQTASTVDAMLKSDPGDYSNSFGSRAGSGYIECVFHLSSSMEPGQKESCSSQSMQHNETLDSVFPEEQTKAVYYDIPNSSLQKQIASSSSCVTWDEKAEIVEPRSQQSDGNEASEMLWTKSDADSHSWRAVDFTNVDKTDSLPNQENNPQSILSLNQVDDVESTPEMLWTKSDADSHGRRTVDLTNVDKTDSLPEVENNFRSMSSQNQISDIESAPEMLWTGSDADSHAVRAVDKTDSPPDLENNLRSMSSQNQISYVESAPEMLRTISDADSHAARAVDETDSLHDLENNLRSMSSQNQIGYIGSAPEMLWRKSDLDSHAARAVDETDSPHDLENNLRSMSSQNQIDDTESYPEMLWTEYDADGHGMRVFDFSNVDKIDSPPDLESNLKSMSSQNQIDDVESAPEVLWSKSDADSHLVRAVDFRNIDKTDSQPDPQNNHRSISSQSQIDDVESEPENYMDALNTIESESENELDCQTKTEVEHTSGINDKGIDETHEHSVKLVDHNSLELESDTASCSSSDEGITSNISNSVSPNSFGHEQSAVNDFDHSTGGLPQVSELSSDLDQTVVEDFGGKADVLKDSSLGSVISGQIDLACEISDIQDPSRDKIISNICESEETPADFSGVHSVKFWTNGGLLGLEPSKPPDYMTPNGVGHNSMNRSKDEAVCHSAHRKLKGDEDEEHKSKLAKTAGEVEKDSGYECSTSCQNDEEEVSTKKTDWGSSQAGSDAKCEKNRVMAPRIDVPITPDIKAIPPEAKSRNDENDENDENSSIMFGLSRRLLANGFSKKVSFSHDDNSEIGSFANAVNQTIAETTFEEQFGHESVIDSVTSSPPLEHMKISFHPLNSFETPKLKLKFPDGNQCLEGIRDVFPSFQLVPEHDIPLNDFGSESDDDTFCRSSPCKSPDSNSHYSESNSEQWESGETPERKALELYDALCGISSEESMLSSLDLGGIATNGICIDGGTKSADSKKGMEPSSCGPFLDLPNFDTLNPIPQQDMKEDSYPLKSEHSQQPTPQPPPLPPAQWWGSKSHLDVTEDKQNDVSKALRHDVDLKLVESPVLQQPKLAPANHHHTSREATTVERKSKQQDHQKLNEQKDAYQASNGKGMDDREDFLQQIRSKSFSLRSTMSTKPTNTPGPAANVKVTAILEKASAIRQAVASDDGDDDDTWSDA